MVVAFVKGLQGNDKNYWLSAALMKHFLANSNEDDRDKTSSNFDERLFREYYSVPFRMGVIEGGSRAFMASYNSMNGVPMTIHPVLKSVTRKEWGQDGIICTDAGAMRNLVSSQKYSPDFDHAAAASVKAGIGQFLDRYADAVRGALKRGLLVEADIDGLQYKHRIAANPHLPQLKLVVEHQHISISSGLQRTDCVYPRAVAPDCCWPSGWFVQWRRQPPAP